MIKSESIKSYARRKGISYYRIGKKRNVSEATIYRILRDEEIPDEIAKEIFSAIDEISTHGNKKPCFKGEE